MYLLQGKGDGLAIDTSGLTDNWDDAEGRYCKFHLILSHMWITDLGLYLVSTSEALI